MTTHPLFQFIDMTTLDDSFVHRMPMIRDLVVPRLIPTALLLAYRSIEMDGYTGKLELEHYDELRVSR